MWGSRLKLAGSRGGRKGVGDKKKPKPFQGGRRNWEEIRAKDRMAQGRHAAGAHVSDASGMSSFTGGYGDGNSQGLTLPPLSLSPSVGEAEKSEGAMAYQRGGNGNSQRAEEGNERQQQQGSAASVESSMDYLEVEGGKIGEEEERERSRDAAEEKRRRKYPWLQWTISRPIVDLLHWLQSLGRVFGTSLVIVIMLVYGVNQGFGEALQDISTNYYWKDVQLLEPGVTQTYTALSNIPWDLKPIYGLITDAFPISGYQRRPYLAILAVLGMVSWWTLTVLPPGTPLFATLILGGIALATAFPDVVVDAVVAQQTRLHPSFAGDLQSLSWGSMSVGGLVGYFLSGPTVEVVGTKGSFWILSLTFGAILCAAFLLPEERLPLTMRSSQIANLLKSFRLFIATIRSRTIWRPALFIYLAHGGICPDISQALFFWYTDERAGPGFKETFMGFVYAMGYVGSLLGVALYNRFFKHTPYRRILFWAQILMCVAGLLDLILVTRTNQKLGIPDHAFGIGDKAASNGVARLQLIPMLVLAARLCPPGIEGTLFAFLMSVSNFGRHTAEWEGALLLQSVGVTREDYSGLWIAVLIRTAMRLSPIFFLFLVPEGNSETDIALKLESEEGVSVEDDGEKLLEGGRG